MLARFCVVALVLFSVFSIFCITLFGPQHQEATSWLALDPMGLKSLGHLMKFTQLINRIAYIVWKR